MIIEKLHTDPSIQTWLEANQAYLDGELVCLRLRLQRRVNWLRRQWQSDNLHAYPQVISDQQADHLLIGEDLAAEQQFYENEMNDLSQKLHAYEKGQAERAAAMQRDRQPSTLDLVADLFGLNPFEQRVLLLCLAPELDPTFAELYAYVEDHAERKYATPHLALTLFGGDNVQRQAAQNSFLPGAPLHRFALLEKETIPGSALPSLWQPLHLPTRLVDYLRGVNHLDSRIEAWVKPVDTVQLPPSQQDLARQLSEWVHTFATGPLTINLVGEHGAGKQAVAQAICDQLGLRLYRLEVPHQSEQDLDQWLRLLGREATLSNLAYYVQLPATPSEEAAAMKLADALLERPVSLMFLGSEERWLSDIPLTVVRVVKPEANEQGWLWQQALAQVPHRADDCIGTIVQQFDFGPRTIVQALAAAQTLAQIRSPDNGTLIQPDDLWQACREQSAPRLEQLARRIVPAYTWNDIVLPEDLLQQMHEIASQVTYRHQVYETWGFGVTLNRGRGISALFSGPSGTGKTMAAEILANELKLDLYRIDLSGVVSKYIGETEKNLKQVFDAAEQSGAILFFDEADALFGKRSEVKDSHDRYANIEVNYLLQRMEDYRGLAILATNRKSALDRAFMRRLRFLLEFPFPDAENRRRIWEKSFPQNTPLDALDYKALSRLEIPGGNVRNVALNAAFLAASQGTPVRMEHVMRAARREYSKIEKMVTTVEFGDYFKLVQP